MYEKVQDNNPTTKLTNKTYGYIIVELIHVVAVDTSKQSKKGNCFSSHSHRGC